MEVFKNNAVGEEEDSFNLRPEDSNIWEPRHHSVLVPILCEPAIQEGAGREREHLCLAWTWREGQKKAMLQAVGVHIY